MLLSARRSEAGGGRAASDEAKRRGPKTPYEDRIRWTPEEREAMIAAGVEVLRADPTGRLRVRQAMKRAMLKVIPAARHRRLANLSAESVAWFVGPVMARLSPAPAPSPAPTPAPHPTAVVIPADDQGLPAGLNSHALMALALARMAAEREEDRRADAAILGEVRRLGQDLRALEARLADRLQPLESNTAVGHRLLRTVLEHLDPDLLRAFDASHQDLGPLAPPLPVPTPPPPSPDPTPAAAPTTATGPRLAATPPPCKVCVIGLRPAAADQVRATVKARAELTVILDESKAMTHDFRQYHGVVITRHTGHAVTTRIHNQASQDRVIRLRSTSAEGVARSVLTLAAKHDQDWKQRQA